MNKANLVKRMYQILEQPIQSECSQYFVYIMIKIIELHDTIKETGKEVKSEKDKEIQLNLTIVSHAKK